MYPPHNWDAFREPPDEPEPEPAEPAGEAPPLTECWRCGKQIDPRYGACPVCRAPVQALVPAPAPRPARPALVYHAGSPPAQDSVKAVLWMFALLLVTSVIQGWWVAAEAKNLARGREELQRALLNQMIAFECIDTFLVFIAFAWAGRPPTIQRTPGQYGAAWAVAFPLLAMLVGVNWLYHEALRQFLGQNQLDWPQIYDGKGWSAGAAVLYGVRVVPYRYLADGTTGKILAYGSVLRGSLLDNALSHYFAGRS